MKGRLLVGFALAAATAGLAAAVAAAGDQQPFPEGRFTSPLVAAYFTRFPVLLYGGG